MTDRLPDDVERFISDHIESVEAVNVLLLLFAQPARRWTAELVSRESRTNEWSAELHLESLSAHGLLRALPGTPRAYQAESTHSGVVGSLARLFIERRVAVISFIYSRPDK